MTAPQQPATTTGNIAPALRPPVVITPAKQHTARRIAVSKSNGNRRTK